MRHVIVHWRRFSRRPCAIRRLPRGKVSDGRHCVLLRQLRLSRPSASRRAHCAHLRLRQPPLSGRLPSQRQFPCAWAEDGRSGLFARRATESTAQRLSIMTCATASCSRARSTLPATPTASTRPIPSPTSHCYAAMSTPPQAVL